MLASRTAVMQIAHEARLHHVAKAAGPRRRQDELLVLVHREEDDRRCRPDLAKVGRDVEPAQSGHRDVEDDDVRSQGARGDERRLPVPNGTDDVAGIASTAVARASMAWLSSTRSTRTGVRRCGA